MKSDRLSLKWLGTYLSCITLAISVYLLIFHAHHYSDTLLLTGFFGGMLSLHVLITLWFKLIRLSRWNGFASFLVLMAFAIPAGFIIFSAQRKYETTQLEKHGIFVNAKVVELFRKKSRTEWVHWARFEYVVDDKLWMQKVRNPHNHYSFNQELRIRCSFQQPEIFRIIDDGPPPVFHLK